MYDVPNMSKSVCDFAFNIGALRIGIGFWAFHIIILYNIPRKPYSNYYGIYINSSLGVAAKWQSWALSRQRLPTSQRNACKTDHFESAGESLGEQTNLETFSLNLVSVHGQYLTETEPRAIRWCRPPWLLAVQSPWAHARRLESKLNSPKQLMILGISGMAKTMLKLLKAVPISYNRFGAQLWERAKASQVLKISRVLGTIGQVYRYTKEHQGIVLLTSQSSISQRVQVPL